MVDGIYVRQGSFKSAPRYRKTGIYDGNDVEFSLYRWMPEKWYLSAHPRDVNPGTSSDVDFYTSDTENAEIVPPSNGWKTRRCGVNPTPTVHVKNGTEDEEARDNE